MALPDRVQGATRPAMLITWLREDGTPEDLTGATMTAWMRRARTADAPVEVSGTLAPTANADDGEFQWLVHDDDIAVAGDFDVEIVATFGSAPTVAKTFNTTWTITPSLSG